MNQKHIESVFIILLMVASAYLTVGAMDLVQNLPLTIYHFGSDGRSTPSLTNTFGAGEPIWVAIPSDSIGSSVLVASDSLGREAWSQASTDHTGVSPRISLGPTLFPPNRNYQLVLQTIREILPGISIIDHYVAEFAVVPSSAQLASESYSPPIGSLGTQVRLADSNGNPTTGVRLGLFLTEGNSSTYLASEKTDLQGRVIFQIGQSLSAGRYGLEVKVLDNSAVIALPFHASDFTVQVSPSLLKARLSNGGVTSTLVQAEDNAAIQGRLVILQNQLPDGNWTISATAYTDDRGQASFSTAPPGPWRASFGGDQFYGPALSTTSGAVSAPNPSVSPTPTPSIVYGSLASRPDVVRVPESGGCNTPCCVMPIGYLPLVTSESVINTPISPQCGGGGGGGTPVSTTTTLFLPPSAYSTITTVLTGRVKDVYGNPVVGQGLEFYNSTSEVYLIGIGNTNSTGYASVVWTPNTVGIKTIMAVYIGDSSHYGSQATGNIPVSPTPTFVELLNPSPIAYSWDLYNYYNTAGRPIVVPVVTLQLAMSGTGLPANIYMPPTSGSSASPPNMPGYAWTGLNKTTVTITFNGTYVQTQAMNWTRNFYMPPCPNPTSCSSIPRFGHMNFTASLSPPSTLYASASTKLNIPYQNLNSVSGASTQPAVDNSQIAACIHYTQGCSSLFSTSHGYDIIIVYTHEALDYNVPSCTFAVSDKAGLTWLQRGSTVLNDLSGSSWRSQFAEFWARSVNPLSSDNITETCSSTNPSNYGYHGYQVVAISGANFNTPFDPNVLLPSSMPGSGSGSSVTISTTSPSDMIISGVQGGSGSYVPIPGPGFTKITGTGGIATEYEIVNSPLTNFAVTFSFSTSGSWEQIADAIQPLAQVNQTATPPSHIYVGVNATYPYISIKMQNLSVALEAYVAYLAHTLGPPLSSTTQCPSTCYNYYSIPVPSSTQGSDFAYVCSSSPCTSPSVNTVLNLYNSHGTLCTTTTTDYQGMAHLNLVGPSNCTYPYYYLSTPNTQIVLSELFGIEAVSNPYPFYTNFQGYNYAIYAPQQVGRYLLHMHTYYQSSTFTIINPTTSYSDVQQAYLTCCDLFLTVEKHPTTTRVGVTPSMATVIDNVNASITLTDQAKAKGIQNVSVNYSLKRNDPNPTTLSTGTITTGPNGNTTLILGKLAYGGYTLIVSWAGNSTEVASSYNANFTIWRARTILIISPGWIHATAGNQYLFTTTLIDNATKSIVAVSGLVEQVYINGALYSNTELCSTSGCSVTNYYLTNPGGNVTFPWKASAAGQYFINATFPQQSYYPRTSFQIEASVTLRPVMLVAANSPFQPNTNDPVTWTIQAYDLLDNASIAGLSITPYINGSSYPTVTTDTTGHATFPNKFTSPGFYNVTFSSAPTTVYNSATTQNSLKVFTPTTLTISGGTVYLGLQNSLSVTLKDNIGNPLGGRTVLIKVNGASYTTVTTGSNGQASFNWQPTSLGNYTVAASYSPTGQSDAGFQPSSASVMVNIKPVSVVNTQSTGSGTQSVTLNGGQGSAASGGALSYTFQFSPSSATVTLQFNGRQSQASVNTWNEFGWICVARVFGACVLSVPFLKIHVDMGVPNVFDLHMAGFVPIGPPSVSQDVNTSPQADVISEELGTIASLIIPIVGSAIIIAGGGPLDLGAVAAGGLVNAGGLDVALLAAVSAYLLGTMSRDGLKSFIQGLIVPVMAGAACAVLACQVDLPALAPPLETDIAAIGAWAFYWVIGVIIPWALEGWLSAIAIGLVLLLASLIYSGL